MISVKTRWTTTALLVLGASLLAGPAAANFKRDFEITTLSNRADFVSGGDVLVEVQVPRHIDLDKVVVTLNNRDVTGAFKPSGANTLQGLVTGLRDGKNTLEAGFKIRHKWFWWFWEETVLVEKLKVTNHPIGGPIFSGPQIQPWVCATPTAQPGTATVPHTNPSGLTTFATDAQCDIATEFKFW
jgi:vacuolar-type H+-ATPase catalytic subunit A/Vma1